MTSHTYHHPRAIGNTHEVIEQLVGRGSGRLLDAGAGDGALAGSLAHLGYRVTLADIECCIEPRPQGFVETDFNQELPFADGTFEIAVSSETIEHLENPWHFMREISRVVRNGGIVVISTPNVSQLFSRLLFAISGVMLWFQPCDVAPLGHITPIHQHALRLMGERAGLLIQDTRFSRGRIPKLNIVLPLENRFVGETMIVRFKKGVDGG